MIKILVNNPGRNPSKSVVVLDNPGILVLGLPSQFRASFAVPSLQPEPVSGLPGPRSPRPSGARLPRTSTDFP